MHRRGRASPLAALIPLAGAVAGCATREPPRQVVLVRTFITDFKAVAGKWKGVLAREPESDEEDWLDRAFSLRDGHLSWSAPPTGPRCRADLSPPGRMAFSASIARAAEEDSR